MIKTLRITTIIAGVLAVIFLVLPMFLGGRNNKAIEQFLNSSGVVEKYNMGAENNAKITQDQTSPLVTQAENFAQYLNPPPKPEPSIPEASTPTVPTPMPISPVTAKFTLVGTSVYVTQPELSLAFIDEPGKGSRWVRQGSQLEHLTIKQVKDGLVVLQDGQRTFEIAVQQQPEKSLVENPPHVSSKVISGTSTGPDVTTSREPDAATTISTPISSSEEQMAMLEEFLKSVQAHIESGEINVPDTENPSYDFRKMRISNDEAEKLKDLPKQLFGPEPNAAGPDTSQQASSAEGERPAEPNQGTHQSTVQETPAVRPPVDPGERLTAEPNQVKKQKVRRPVGLPQRTRRNR